MILYYSFEKRGLAQMCTLVNLKQKTHSICDIVDSKIYILQTFGRMIFNYIDNSMKVKSLNQIFLCGIDLFSSIKQKKRRYTVSTHHIHCLERSIIISCKFW